MFIARPSAWLCSALGFCWSDAPPPVSSDTWRRKPGQCRGAELHGFGKTHVAKVHCLNAAEERHILPGVQYPDFWRVRQSQRVVLAGKVDRGEMTKTEADAQMDLVSAQLVSEEQRRVGNAQVASAAQQAAFSQSLVAAGAAMSAASPPPASRSVTCQRVGSNTVTCDRSAARCGGLRVRVAS